MISDGRQFPPLPRWALRPESRETFENTLAVGGFHAFGVMMGFDAFRVAIGQEPTTFTRCGVMRWMEVVCQSCTHTIHRGPSYLMRCRLKRWCST